MPLIDDKWNLVKKALEAVEVRRKSNRLPFTCFYSSKGKLLGSYVCSNEEEEAVLFVNKDYSDSALLIDLINLHCQYLNDEVSVYTLDAKSIQLYEMIYPQNFVTVEL